MQAKEHTITINILLHQGENGKIIASALEMPECRVEESSRELAIDSLRDRLMHKFQAVEIVALELPIDPIDDRELLDLDRKSDMADSSQPGWLKSAGLFKADPQFEAFQQEIQSYRTELDKSNS